MPFERFRASKASPKTMSPIVEKTSRPGRRLLGLRKYVEPQNVSRATDIVFVHGLTGSGDKTWTCLSNDSFWPAVLLPADLPDARIFTYDYDADVAHFFARASQSRIGNHAQTLLGSLANLRERSETADRPLLFVAHSLGGLVVEDMLLAAKNSAEEHHRRILESTSGICFMGTPHCGSQLADWARIFTSITKVVKEMDDSIITVLQPESEVLARIQKEFHTMLRARAEANKPRIQITCFYEDLGMRGIGTVVPKHSAILPAYHAMSIHKDHVGMTKFADAEDAGYQAVSNELWRWARDVNKARDQAGSLVSPVDQPSERPHLPIENDSINQAPVNYFQGPISHNGLLFQGNNIGTYHHDRI